MLAAKVLAHYADNNLMLIAGTRSERKKHFH